LLGLVEGASAVDIRAAHRRAMRQAHPDAGGDGAQAARLNAARDFLLGD
jgi:curved DNA-binding protein CbpA